MPPNFHRACATMSIVGDVTPSGPYGPIQPSDATDGWKLEGDETGWWLSKEFGDTRAHIKATSATTCAWRAGWREASARSVEDAKEAADHWMEKHWPPQ